MDQNRLLLDLFDHKRYPRTLHFQTDETHLNDTVVFARLQRLRWTSISLRLSDIYYDETH